jgi:hypothetical protein
LGSTITSRLTGANYEEAQAAVSDHVMTYLHPRDFDAKQPIINELSMLRKFKSYVGLKNAESKLEKWLSGFEFTDIQTAIQKIDWENVPVVEI